MLVIRLFRVGKRNQPSFKIVVTDKTKAPKAGRFVEEVGFLNPLTKQKVLKAERIKYWISVGAKPSATIHNLLVSEKIVEGKKIVSHNVKKVEPSAGGAKPAEPKAQEVAQATAPAVKAEEPKKEEIKEEKPVKVEAEIKPEEPAKPVVENKKEPQKEEEQKEVAPKP
jgi:small subunit ribosomal protein S16